MLMAAVLQFWHVSCRFDIENMEWALTWESLKLCKLSNIYAPKASTSTLDFTFNNFFSLYIDKRDEIEIPLVKTNYFPNQFQLRPFSRNMANYIYIYIYIYIVYVYACISVYVYVCICRYVYVYMYMYVYINIYIIYIYINIYIYIYIYLFPCVQVVYVYVYINVYISF